MRGGAQAGSRKIAAGLENREPLVAMAEIRAVAPDEWEKFKALRLRALEESPGAFGSTLEAERMLDVDIWKRWVAERGPDEPERRVLIAEEGEAWVGCATLSGDAYEADLFKLFDLWVAPEARRRGVGRRLVEALVDFAKASETRKRIILQVGEDSAPARALFEACGFTDTGDRLPLRADLETEALTLELPLERPAD